MGKGVGIPKMVQFLVEAPVSDNGVLLEMGSSFIQETPVFVRSAARNEDCRAEARFWGDGGRTLQLDERSELRLGKPLKSEWNSATFTFSRAKAIQSVTIPD